MSFFSAGLDRAWQMILDHDPYLEHLTWVTIKVATIPTAIGAVIGVPLGVALGLGRFRGRGFVLGVANAGLGLPPVVVGIVLALLFFPQSLLGSLHLIFTLRGVYVAQTVLAFPIILALTSSAVRALPDGLFDQARGFGANRLQLSMLAVREARIGIFAALIAAIGSGLSEVAAVILVGGSITNLDETLGSAALTRINAGDFVTGLAIGIILLALILVVSLLFTALQYWSGQTSRIRRPS